MENLIWWVGALTMSGGFVLSYWAMYQTKTDFTLFGAKASPDVFVNLLLCICLLNEQVIYRYDMPGILLIFCGSVATVYIINEQDRPKLEGQKLRDIIHSWKSNVYMTVASVICIVVYCLRQPFVKALRRFETDAEEHDQKLIQERGSEG